MKKKLTLLPLKTFYINLVMLNIFLLHIQLYTRKIIFELIYLILQNTYIHIWYGDVDFSSVKNKY